MWLSIGRRRGKDMEPYEQKLEDAGFITDWVDTGLTREGEKEYEMKIKLDSLNELLRLSNVLDRPLVINDEWEDSSDIVIEDCYRH